MAAGFIAVVFLMFALRTDAVPPGAEPRDLDVQAVAILALAFGVVAVRRRAPGTVAVATLVLSAVWYGSRYTSGIISIPFMIAFYELGTTGDRRRQLGVGGLAAIVLLVGTLVLGEEGWDDALSAIGWMSAAILFGELVRSRRLLLVAHAARAERAEAERDAEAERRVAEERIRIARDVHDVLAHTVSLMTVQAGVAADALERDPGEAKAALGAIRAAGREAMGEVRALVSVLRDGSEVGTAPAPGLLGIDEVVAAARASGVAVELSVDLAGAPLPAIVELTAFRLVQEGLTNIVRHAQAARAEIDVRRDGAELMVRIRDDGRGRPARHPVSPGFGLRGMRERVESLGGTLTFGPGPHGGWVVAAVVPAGSGKTQ